MDMHFSNIRNELFLLEQALKKNTKTKETSKSTVKASKKKDLSKYTTTQLKEFAKKNKIKTSNKNKVDIIDSIWKFMDDDSSDESSDSSDSSDDSSDSD
jgi:hypothetical protein